jgi:signal transduction histidine kinase/ligand-binding sensor domain-containing protein
MTQKMSRVWPVLLAGGFALAVEALATTNNPAWSARVWQSDEGLPGNSVSGVVQTPDGYLWVATDSGLARFDGVRFQNIAVPIPSGRTRPLIRAILLGRDNQLWLALEGGLAVSWSRQATNLFTTTNGILPVRPVSIAQDQARAVWIGYADGNVCRIAGGRVTRFMGSNAPAGNGVCLLKSDIAGNVWFAKSGNVGLFRSGSFQSLLVSNEAAVQLGQARAGGVWCCAGLQLWHYSTSGQVVKCAILPTDRSGVEPTAVFEDQNGAVWVGTSVNGLFRYDGTNFARVETPSEEILSLGEDHEGDLWAGTAGAGLSRLRPRTVELQGAESGLPSAMVRSICEDRAGVMWAVAQNGDLAVRRDGQWNKVTGNDGRSDVQASCVVGDGQSGVWIGTDHGELQRWTNGRFSVLGRGNGLGGDLVRGLLVDHTGDLWIALDAPRCLQRLHHDQFQTFAQPASSGFIRALAEDTAGTLWCGTYDGFLFRVEGGTLKDETLQTLPQLKPIRCLNAMPDGSVWIGYAGAGLGIWHNGKFAQITVEQGLPDAYVCAMAADGGGGFWCATDHGIFEVRLDELEAVAGRRAERVHSILFGRDEGLKSLQGFYGYAPATARSQDGRLWFPMRTGLAVVNPLRAPVNRVPPPVLIERVAVDGIPVEMDAGRPLVVPSAHRRLDVDFTALSFVAPENVRFRYRLEGWDPDWIDGGTQRSANYSRLPAGTYTFRVTACNNAGIWNENGAAIPLMVPPFLWQRWQVRAASLGLFTLGLIAAVRYVSFRRLRLGLARLEQETSLHRERARIAQDLHDDIGASLTHIALLSELAQRDFDKPIQAKTHLDQIFRSARTVVRSLDEIVWTLNPKNNTLDLFIAYLCTYTPDYLRSAGIRCRLDVPVDVPTMPLPSDVGHHLYLAVKETLHNVVKHAGATEVWLRLRLAAETITLTIEDNGGGFQTDHKSAPNADGLGNLNRRLGEIGGSCEQCSPQGSGTTTKFIVSLKNARR